MQHAARVKDSANAVIASNEQTRTFHTTEHFEKARTRCCEKFLPSAAWLLLSKTCMPFPEPLYVHIPLYVHRMHKLYVTSVLQK